MKKLILLTTLLLLAFQSLPPVVVVSGQSNALQSYPYISLAGYDIINCAVGGTSVTKWQRGQVPYENCLDLVAGRDIAGILHFQGERDSRNANVYLQWTDLTLQFFNHFREDTNSQGVRIVYARLGLLPTDVNRPYWNKIKNQQNKLPDFDSTLYMINTSDINPYCPIEGPHWCPEGYQAIADRFEYRFLLP